METHNFEGSREGKSDIQEGVANFWMSVSEIASQLEKQGTLSKDERQAIENADKVESASEAIASKIEDVEMHNPEESQGFLGRVSRAIKQAPGMLALAAGLEVLAANTALAQTQPEQRERAEETLPGVSREHQTGVDFTERSVGYYGEEHSAILRHNIRWPESLPDIGRMLVEPVSVVFTFPYEQNSPIARVLVGERGEREEDFRVELDFPYQYAEHYDKATPQDRARMEAEMRERAADLLRRLLPVVVGPSFFKGEVLEEHGPRERTYQDISEAQLVGYASPESDLGINLNDPRNQELSRLRAENAAHVLRQICSDEGIPVEAITFSGGGEIPVSPEEETRLEELATIEIDKGGKPKDRKIFDLVRRYNDGLMKEEDAKKELYKIVGSKRKVAVNLNLDERRGMLVIPVPILLILLGSLLGRAGDRRRRPPESRRPLLRGPKGGVGMASRLAGLPRGVEGGMPKEGSRIAEGRGLQGSKIVGATKKGPEISGKHTGGKSLQGSPIEGPGSPNAIRQEGSTIENPEGRTGPKYEENLNKSAERFRESLDKRGAKYDKAPVEGSSQPESEEPFIPEHEVQPEDRE